MMGKALTEACKNNLCKIPQLQSL